MALWQKFVFVVAGYWILERISHRFPACQYLTKKEERQAKSTGRWLPGGWQAFRQCLVTRFAISYWVIMAILGLSIAPFFTYFEQFPVVMDVEDVVGMDWLMRITQQKIPSAQAKDIPQFVLLDIDDDTYKQWGEPLFTPRYRLQRLIDAAVQAQARLVIVDIDLSRPTPIDGLPSSCGKLQLHPYDQNLVNYFKEKYPYDCATHSNCPPIILARTFSNGSHAALPPYQHPRLAFTELEQVVANSNAHIQWASPLFHLSRDRVLRRWSFWQPICTDQQPGVIASIGVMAGVLLDSDTPKQASQTINNALVPFKPQNCVDSEEASTAPNLPSQIKIGRWTLNTNPYSVQQRIMYTMPWLIEHKKTGKMEPFDWLTDESGFPIVTRLSAQHFAEEHVSVETLADYVKGGIVVIGGSYGEGRDYHQTPLGLMPGALVLINAMHSLLQYETIQPVPKWLKWLIIASLILVMSVIFLCVTSFWLGQLFNLLIVFAFLPISIALFHYGGIWLDFATPLIFVQVYQIAVFSALLIYCLLLSFGHWLRRLLVRLYSFVNDMLSLFKQWLSKFLTQRKQHK